MITDSEANSRNSRKKRVTLTMDNIKKIISMKEKNYKVSEIAEIVEMSTVGVYKILNRISIAEENGNDPLTIIRKLGRKIQDNMPAVQSIAEIVQFDNTLTQRQMKAKLEERNVSYSQPTISRLLHKAEITRKRLKARPSLTQTPAHLEKRKVYAREIRVLSNELLIYIDETGFNLHTGAKYGYSPKNTDAYRLVPRDRQRNVSLLACISNRGVIYHKIEVGSFTGAKVASFLEEAKTAIKKHNRQAVVIMDNAAIHHSTMVQQFSVRSGIRLHYLPAYCPQLNPIEEFFGSLKARYSQISNNITNSDQIKKAVTRIIHEMEGDLNFDNYYQNMRRYLDMAFQSVWF